MLHITEFAELGHIAGQGDVQAAAVPVAYQSVATDGTNKQSAAFSASTRMIRVYADEESFVMTGTNPNALAGTGGFKIKVAPAAAEYFMAVPGQKIAVVTA